MTPLDTRLSIIQFWDNDTPPYIQELLDSVRTLNPEFDYDCFNDESARSFIQQHYGSGVLDVYNDCTIPAMRADLFRYCYLHEIGGLYLDADYRALTSLAPLTELAPRGYLYKHNKGICNGTLLFKQPRDSLVAAVLEMALSNLSGLRESSNVWEITGPAIFHALHRDPERQYLFENFAIIDDEQFFRYIKPVPHLPYKQTDAHWAVAWKKQLPIRTGGG